MRVMVVARLFSGIADSLLTGTWQPKGVPAIYRLLEELAARQDIELLTVFACKDAQGGRFTRSQRLQIAPIGAVEILPWAPRPILAMLGLDGKLRELGHLIRCLWLFARFRPDASYFTNANFLAAGLFARLGLGRVILRFLGIHPEQKRLSDSRAGFQRWLYRSPFDRAICSLDGSGGKAYLPRLLNPTTPLHVLLNGVDPQTANPKTVTRLRKDHGLGDRPVVAFIGRLEANKGCREFVAAVIDVLARRPGMLDAVIVGSGALHDELAGRISASRGAANIRMIGQVPHGLVPAWLDLASIYVSINHYGGLSNANLEAIAAGKCVIVLAPDPSTHTDEETAEVLPEGSVVRIGRRDIERSLAEALIHLLDTPDAIATYSRHAREVARTTFRPWSQRIATEIDLICN